MADAVFVGLVAAPAVEDADLGGDQGEAGCRSSGGSGVPKIRATARCCFGRGVQTGQDQDQVLEQDETPSAARSLRADDPGPTQRWLRRYVPTPAPV